MNANEVVVGSVAGTGAAINVQLGFIPSYVKVFNPNDAGSLFPAMERWKGMAAASALKTLKIIDSGATGLASSAYVTSNGLSDYTGVKPPRTLTGTCAVSAGSAVVTGTSTLFLSEVAVGNIISIGGVTRKVLSIASNTSLTVTEAYTAAQTGITSFNIEGTSDGFTIGADADINVSGETVFYMAIRS